MNSHSAMVVAREETSKRAAYNPHLAQAYWSGTFTRGSSARTEVCNWTGSTFLRCAHSTRLSGR